MKDYNKTKSSHNRFSCAVPVAGVVVEGRAGNMDVATWMCCTCGRGGCGGAG
jgi:hypothetical protein